MLVAVAPGTYSTDMEVYIRRPMGLLSIGKYGVFTLMPDHFEEPFVAEPGVVYYVGSFNPQNFRFNFEGAREYFVDQFGTLEGTEFSQHTVYRLKAIYGDDAVDNGCSALAAAPQSGGGEERVLPYRYRATRRCDPGKNGSVI